MNRYLKIGLAAAALVVIAVVGYQFLGNSNTGGPGATETPQPTATLAVTPEPSAAGGLPLGPFTLCEIAYCDVGMTLTISAADWDGGDPPGGGILVKNDKTIAPDEAGMIAFTGPLYVYGDPCHWESTRPATPATTIDELVAALSAQASRDASDPVDITVDGYAGKSITLHVPDDIAFSAEEFTDCDEGNFGSFGSDAEPGPARYAQGPGQIDQVWVLDVDGTLVTIDATWYEGTSAEDSAELDAILDSLQFELP